MGVWMSAALMMPRMTTQIGIRRVTSVRGAAVAVLSLCLIAALTVQAAAQSRISLIRDAEIENILRDMTDPILRVAGVAPSGVEIHIVSDNSLNAFVAGGQNIYLHTGLILDTQSPEELVGVIAHEAGHIAAGHLARGRDELERAQRNVLISSLVGLAAALATGDGRAGAAIMSGGGSMAERNFLAYSRVMESSADQASLSYLDRLGWTSEGMLTFLRRLEDQDLLPSSRQSAYTRTHPVTRERTLTVEGHVSRSPATGNRMPASMQEDFDRMQAKLLGFMQPQQALRLYDAADTAVAAQYGRAIANYRRGDTATALDGIGALIAREPNNPYFHELHGQILFEQGRIAEAREPYRQALSLAPDEPLIGVSYAQTLVASDDGDLLREAIRILEQATGRPEGRSPLTWRLLATAYGKTGDVGMASVALAEEALALGDNEAARTQARRAQSQLANGSAGWLKAQDILTTTDD